MIVIMRGSLLGWQGVLLVWISLRIQSFLFFYKNVFFFFSLQLRFNSLDIVVVVVREYIDFIKATVKTTKNYSIISRKN